MKPKAAKKNSLFFLFFFSVLIDRVLVTCQKFQFPFNAILCHTIVLFRTMYFDFTCGCWLFWGWHILRDDSLILHVVVDYFMGHTFCISVWFYMGLLTVSGATHSARYQFDFACGCWLFQGPHILHDISLILHVVFDSFKGNIFCMKTVWFYRWLLTVSGATYSAWWLYCMPKLWLSSHFLRVYQVCFYVWCIH